MHDTSKGRPDHLRLFQIAAGQHGHFTSAQARACGFGTDLLTHHVGSGRFARVFRGVYRLRDYPTAPYDEVAAAWLAIGRDAVVSHESALALLDLSDVVPDAIHLTVPRSRRYLPSISGVRLHTSSYPFHPGDLIEREGIKLTNPQRTIVDAAGAGTSPEQIEMAIRQAIRRGLVLPESLRDSAVSRGQRVARLVNQALEQVVG